VIYARSRVHTHTHAAVHGNFNLLGVGGALKRILGVWQSLEFSQTHKDVSQPLCFEVRFEDDLL